MKEQFLILIAAAMTCAATAAFAEPTSTPTASPPANHAQRYTCPMHPEVVRAEPGQCPKCGTTLVPIKETKPKAEHPMPNVEHAADQMHGEHATHDANGMAMPRHEHAPSPDSGAAGDHEMKMWTQSSVNVADPMSR